MTVRLLRSQDRLILSGGGLTRVVVADQVRTDYKPMDSQLSSLLDPTMILYTRRLDLVAAPEAPVIRPMAQVEVEAEANNSMYQWMILRILEALVCFVAARLVPMAAGNSSGRWEMSFVPLGLVWSDSVPDLVRLDSMKLDVCTDLSGLLPVPLAVLEADSKSDCLGHL